MKSVHELSKETGISIRTIHYYDEIGILKPTIVKENGYRYYDESSLYKLEQIMILKELEFSLDEIKEILDNPQYDRLKAIEDQIKMLEAKKDHLIKIIEKAKEIKKKGGIIGFNMFNNQYKDTYKKLAKEKWGATREYKEFESKNYTNEQIDEKTKGLYYIFKSFGSIIENGINEEALNLVKTLQEYISINYYQCSNEVLLGLGEMYLTEEFTKNIDSVSGDGTSKFVNECIKVYVH